MAIDLKQGIDLKQLGPQIKALFAKDSNVFGNKLVIFSVVAILVTLLLAYLIYDISDNQSVFDGVNGSNNNALVKISNIEKKLEKTLGNNKVYFNQLATAPKTKSKLSASITSLVSQYSLRLGSIDLKSAKGVQLVVSGTYLNLIRFSSEMNKLLSASQLTNLTIIKSGTGGKLNMSLSIVFSAPPAPNSLPIQKTKKIVKLINLDTVGLRVKTQPSMFYDLIGLFVSSVNAAEVEINGLSLFQQAHSKARAKGLTKFKFTNKAGEVKEYLTGLKPTKKTVAIKNEVKQVEINGLSLFQQAHSKARAKGLTKFKFTNKAGEIKEYLTGLKPTKKTVAIKNEVKQVEINGLSLFQQAHSKARAKGLTKFKFTNKAGEIKEYLTGLKPTKKTVAIKNEVKQVEINGLSLFQQAHSKARAKGLTKFKFTNKAGEIKEYLTGLKPTKKTVAIKNKVKQVKFGELVEISVIDQVETLPPLGVAASKPTKDIVIKSHKVKPTKKTVAIKNEVKQVKFGELVEISVIDQVETLPPLGVAASKPTKDIVIKSHKVKPTKKTVAIKNEVKQVEINGLSLFQQAHSKARAKGLTKFKFTNKAGEVKEYLTGLKPTKKTVAIKNKVKQVKFGELVEISVIDQVETLPPLGVAASKPTKDIVIKSHKVKPTKKTVAIKNEVKQVEINGLSLFQQAHSKARAKGLTKFKFTNKAGEVKEYLTGLKPNKETLSPLGVAASKPTKDIVIKRHKARPLNDFQRAYADALIQGQATFEYKNKNGKNMLYKTNKESFELAGFTENPTENDSFTKQESETQDSAPTENLRDPFAAPSASGAPKNNRREGASDSEEPYYLSGILTSEMIELCVVITPLGESKIYQPRDKITDKIVITSIFSNGITTNLSNKKILIGDEIR